MNTIVMQIESATCSSPEQTGASLPVSASEEPQPMEVQETLTVIQPRSAVSAASPSEILTKVEVDNNKRVITTSVISSTQISSPESSAVIRSVSNNGSFNSPIRSNPIVSTIVSPSDVYQQTSPVLKNPESLDAAQEQITNNAPNTTSVVTSARALRGVIQPLNAVELVVKDKIDGIGAQKVFNIVNKSINVAQKMPLNNNNNINNNGQRVITNINMPRGNVAGNNPLKVHVVNSKGNLTKAPLQVQRQIMGNLPAKQLGNGTKAIVNKNQMIMKSNNMVTKPPMLNNIQKASYKTISRTTTNAKTIKTLSPQSPQSYAPKSGIKTLSPQNHMGKAPNTLKMIPNQPNIPRMGIKTLTPQRPAALNNRPNSLTQKPNYIGKHAAQAHKSHQKTGPGHQLKGRGGHPPPQRHSPTKYLQQKSGLNAQSSFNQALTAQILQSLPQAGGRSESYQNIKNYVAHPSDSNISDDIGEEVKPEMSPNVNYLYQVVMLDHNYSSSVAPMPAVSPTVPVSSAGRQQQQQPVGINGVPGMSPGYHTYHGTASGKRHRMNSGSHAPPPSLPVQNTVAVDPVQDDDAASTISSEGHRDHPGEEGEETETAPEGEGDEDGITRCICDYDHDDGYMICCDICSSWQHVDCMGLDRNAIPEKYACVRCEPRRVDRAHARAIQQRKREELAASDSGSSGSDTSTAESTGGGDRHLPLSLNNNLIGNNNNKKRSVAPVTLPPRRKSEPPVHQRRQSLAQKRQQQRRDNLREGSATGRRTLKKREKKQVMKRKMKSRSSVDDDSQDSWPSPSIPPQASTNIGANLLQLRQWIENYEEAVTNHYSPELRARLANMRANGSHVPPPQTGVIGGVGVPAPSSAQQDIQVQKCKIITQPLTGIKLVMSTTSMPPNSAVLELRGKYMLSTQHRQVTQNPPGGLLTRQHSQQRPGPFLFFYRLPKDGTEVCVDTRTYGNDARFIRRSCRPNAELRHCVEKGTLHLYVVTVTQVEKNQELTIRHETHDLAAVGTTNIACACGNSQQCGLFHNQRKNGGAPPEIVESAISHRKRRGRRTSSPGLASPTPVEPPLASPVPQPPPVAVPPPPPAVTTRRSSHQSTTTRSTTTTATSESERPVERRESRERDKEEREQQQNKDKKKKLTREERKMEAIMKAFERMEKAEQRKQEVQARQAQRRESDPTPIKHQENGEMESKARRKRRKGRARTVSTTSQSNRRRTRLNSTDSYITSGDEGSLLSPPLPLSVTETAQPEILINNKLPESPLKSSGSQISDISSPGQVTTAAGLLLALASGGNQTEQLNKSPPRETDGNSSSSSIQSSPSTPLSSACLLVAAAVGPLEPGFKFPKTKKAIMNEWLNKSPEPVQPVISPIAHTSPNEQPEYFNNQAGGKSLATLVQAASLCDSPPTRHEKVGGNAKKRWLRQAISEECDSPRPESPPSEMVAPPKKRRLARESLSSEQSFTPPTTPTMLVPPSNSVEEDYPNNDEEFYNEERRSTDNSPPDDQDFKSSNRLKDTNRVEIVYSAPDNGEDLLSEQPEMEPDAVLKERVAEMRMEFGSGSVKREEVTDVITNVVGTPLLMTPTPTPSLLDPRLGRCDRPMFRDSAQLLGTVEKTLRFYEENFATPALVSNAEKEEKEKKIEIITPAKRKLSISEYRQRKQLTTTERASIDEERMNSSITNSPGSPPAPPSRPSARRRSDSTSSTTSSLSSEEETISTAVTTTCSTIEISDKTTGVVGFSAAPTEVELQRENVERLKKVFGLSLDDESRKSATSRDSSITSPKSLLVSPPSISPANPISDIKTETSKYLFGLEAKFSEKKHFESIKSESDVKMELPSYDSKESLTELYSETKYSESKDFLAQKVPKEKFMDYTDSKFEVKECKRASSEEKESSDEKYAKFDDTITSGFVPAFNNPVYPNSTQFTGFTSVIDSCPYEGRNPSPPPSEILQNSRYSESGLSMSPDSYK